MPKSTRGGKRTGGARGLGGMTAGLPTRNGTQVADPLAEATERNFVIWMVATGSGNLDDWVDFVEEQSGEATTLEELENARATYTSLTNAQKNAVKQYAGNGAYFGVGITKEGNDVVITSLPRDTSKRKKTSTGVATRRVIAPDGTILMIETVV